MGPARGFVVFVAALAMPGIAEARELAAAPDPRAAIVETKLLASDGGIQDRFGAAVALASDTAIVGALAAEGLVSQPGAAYVLVRGRADGWAELAKLLAGDGGVSDAFGYAVALSGDTAIIGAPDANLDAVEDVGAAYVFARDQGGADAWGEVTKLVAEFPSADEQLGWSVAIFGDVAVVGAPQRNLAESGTAYVFERDAGGPGSWGQVARLVASDAFAYDQFGHAVAAGPDTIVVGAPRKLVAQFEDPGRAYVFTRDGAGNWTEVQALGELASADDMFGWSVAIDASADVIVIGAPAADVAAPEAGSAQVFLRDGGGADSWTEVATLIASDATSNDQLGRSTAIAGDGGRIVVGAFFQGLDTVNGAAYVYERDGADAWTERHLLSPSDDQIDNAIGDAVAIDGDTILAGAPHDSAVALEAGATYVFAITGQLGQACASGRDCDDGNCVDDVCCDSACTDECQACSVAAGAAVDGACGPVADGTACTDGTCEAGVCEPDAGTTGADTTGATGTTLGTDGGATLDGSTEGSGTGEGGNANDDQQGCGCAADPASGSAALLWLTITMAAGARRRRGSRCARSRGRRR